MTGVRDRMLRVAAFGLLAACPSCGGRRLDVTPWFRVERQEPLVDVPHVLQVGQRKDVARALVGGRWVVVSEGSVYAAPFPAADAVLYSDRGEWRIFRRGGEVRKLDAQCAFPVVHPTLPIAYCARCAAGPLDCKGTVLSVLDASGRTTRVLRSDEPLGDGGYAVKPVAQLPDGSVALAVAGECRLFALGARGTVLLGTAPPRPDCYRYESWREVLSRVDAVRLLGARSPGDLR